MNSVPVRSEPVPLLVRLGLQRRRPQVRERRKRRSFFGTTVLSSLQIYGEFAIFAIRTIIALPQVLFHSARRRESLLQVDGLGVGAIPITHITGFIAGLLLGLQTRVSLEQFGITSLFSPMLTLALVREVGPTFVALVAGARAASGITSELATMKVTQQVDALRALRRDPVAHLAAPRTLASTFVFPLLATVGVIAGLFGGMLVATFALGQRPMFFFNSAFEVLNAREIVPNLLVKPASFGLLIGLVSTFLGLRTEGGTRAVGASTVQAVVLVTVGVLIVDYSVGEVFRRAWPPPPW